MELSLNKYSEAIQGSHLTKDSGKVTEVTGLLIKGYLPGASVGSICAIETVYSAKPLLAEVVGFKDQQVLMMALHEMRGVSLGCRITLSRSIATV